MTIRITGMNSGLDTETIINELVSAQSVKVSSVKKKQLALSYKKEAWSSLNTKVLSFYNSSLSDLRLTTAYSKKKTELSDSSYASVSTSSSAMYSSQTLSVHQLAKSGYMTGGEVALSETASSDKISSSTLLSDLGVSSGSISLKVGSGDATEIAIGEDMTISGFLSKMKSAGVNASFDYTYNRFYIASKDTGEKYDFEFTSDSDSEILSGLGLDSDSAKKVDGQDAIIYLNGVEYKDSSNTITVNGLTITANKVNEYDEATDTWDEIQMTTKADTSGIYDMIKKFVTDYSSLINELDKNYNTDSEDYEPLLSDEKDGMSDSEVEDWEEKVKSSVLYRDGNVSTLASALQNAVLKGFTVTGSDGSEQTLYLSSFGINTLSYFESEDNEKHALHIDGDEDETNSNVKSSDNLLRQMIESDPDAVVSFFTQFSQSLYSDMQKLQQSSSLSSA
ncbi:MAG: flagellar filament capping protein FliD, partial [Lachnospiraceae bacterium]|nr:flagellar filament capping protein FliD [Lachnospiraceae bacterium]